MNKLNEVGFMLLENWKDIPLLRDIPKSGVQPLIMEVCIEGYGTGWFKCAEYLTTLAVLTHVRQSIVSRWNFLPVHLFLLPLISHLQHFLAVVSSKC